MPITQVNRFVSDPQVKVVCRYGSKLATDQFVPKFQLTVWPQQSRLLDARAMALQHPDLGDRVGFSEDDQIFETIAIGQIDGGGPRSPARPPGAQLALLTNGAERSTLHEFGKG